MHEHRTGKYDLNCSLTCGQHPVGATHRPPRTFLFVCLSDCLITNAQLPRSKLATCKLLLPLLQEVHIFTDSNTCTLLGVPLHTPWFKTCASWATDLCAPLLRPHQNLCQGSAVVANSRTNMCDLVVEHLSRPTRAPHGTQNQ